MKCDLCIICILCIGYILSLRCDDHYPPLTEAPITSLSPDTVRRIEDAAATLIATGVPNPNNEQVRAHPGGGSLSHISPVMREVVAEREPTAGGARAAGGGTAAARAGRTADRHPRAPGNAAKLAFLRIIS